MASLRLYHILPSEFAISDLALRRMKIARVSDLNDPFELLSYRFENEDLKNAWESSKKKIGDKNGLLCFSKGWQNPVLWSHYGDKHRGICLGFDVPEEAPRHVDYLPERLELKEISLEMAEGFLFSKYKHWEYEEEWRAYVNLDPSTEEGGMYFMEFGDGLKLREVILGARCLVPTTNIQTLLQGIGPGISLETAVLDHSQFRVSADPAAKWTSSLPAA